MSQIRRVASTGSGQDSARRRTETQWRLCSVNLMRDTYPPIDLRPWVAECGRSREVISARALNCLLPFEPPENDGLGVR